MKKQKFQIFHYLLAFTLSIVLYSCGQGGSTETTPPASAAPSTTTEPAKEEVQTTASADSMTIDTTPMKSSQNPPAVRK